MEHTFELMDTVPPTPHDSPLTGGYTLGSDEGRLKLKELMAICIKLSKQVLDLEKEKDEKVVESFNDDLDEEDASNKGRESDKTKSMFQDSDFDVLDDDMEDIEGETCRTATTGVSVPVTTDGVAISTAEPRTPPTTAATAFIDEKLNIAHTLIKMKEEKTKEKGVAIKDVEDSPRPVRSITTPQPLLTIDPKDKGKGVLIEEEPEKPEKVKRRDQGLAQIESDAELAQRLHEEELAELDRAQKERQKIDADHELAVRLILEEKEKYIIEERARLLAEFFERRKKHLAAKRAEAIRNKPPTRTQREEVDDVAIVVESLATKYPIVDWKTHILNENMMYYQIIKADGSSKNYKIFSEMHDDFDRQDVIDLHRVHVQLMNNGVAIHMMIEKKYPLTQEMLSRMLNRRLEVDYESEMAFELLRFTRSQLQK
ncbi:hypothetical protein Tco_1026509 [Tanacetum coccineum]